MPLCFDLDGTLGHFGGGYMLLREALGELWGESPGAEALAACQGSTDWEIVDELHRSRFNRPLTEAHYTDYDSACLAKFQIEFSGRAPVAYPGLLTGLSQLQAEGFPVCVVSGNASQVLDFKTKALGISPHIPRIGSLPRLDRAGLIRKAMEDCQGPHLYVGDRPHDKAAAEKAGIPFIGIGKAVPGRHLILHEDARAEQVVDAIKTLLSGAF